jgi:tRNA(Ile)-lysidine synthase
MDAPRWARLARDVARGGRAADLPGGVRLTFDGNFAVLGRPDSSPAAPPATPVALSIPGAAPWIGGRVVASKCETAADRSDGCEYVDFDRIVPPLTVDAPRPGDRFDPLGLDGHTMALADLLRGRGVARADRGRVAVVRDAAGIVCVVGHRIAHRARLTPQTMRRLAIVWESEDLSRG